MANIGQALAGVAIFLLGMNFLEDTLRTLGGRPFKLFLRKQTSNKFKAVGGGTVVTAVLQSSSVVNLLILSLVGAGVLQLQNALAVMLGSNLGTTISSWMVATLGFKYNITHIAYLLGGVTGISLSIIPRGSRYYSWCKFFLGFSFLFIGLGFIKTGMEEFVLQTDLRNFRNLPRFAFFGMGILLTTIIQSSSTTMALTLSALYSNAIPLPAAMAIVLGSEIGTTLKLFIASAKGLPVKKQVALGNFIINATISLAVLLFIDYFLRFTVYVVGPDNSLIALVFFQTVVNITGIILFFPFLEYLAGFLVGRYHKKPEDRYINKVSPGETTLAGDALEKEARSFLLYVLTMGKDLFNGTQLSTPPTISEKFSALSGYRKYEYIKDYYGEVHNFYVRLMAAAGNETRAEKYEPYAAALRNGMYAAKNLKDALGDMEQLSNSSNETKYSYYQVVREKFLSFSETALEIMGQKDMEQAYESLSGLYREIQDGYARELHQLYLSKGISQLSDTEISTLVNFNREIYTYFKSVIFALKDTVLNETQAARFDDLPGFIR